MKLSIFSLVMFFTLRGFVFAAPAFSVSYVEGAAYLRSGSSWQALAIGDTVSSDASVRLDAGAAMQLKGAGADIYLTQKGTYAVGDLLAARQKLGSAGVVQAISASLVYLLAGRVKNQSTAAGARGADESASLDSEWVESNAQENIDQAKDDIQSGDYTAAVGKLTEALDDATGDEVAETHYYLASAYSLNGDTPDAVRQIAGAKPAGGASWSGDYVLLQAKLYQDTFAFAQAVQWLNQPGNDLSNDAQRASLYYFLLGLGYRGAGDEQKATASLQKVVTLEGTSNLGTTAAGLLQNH